MKKIMLRCLWSLLFVVGFCGLMLAESWVLDHTQTRIGRLWQGWFYRYPTNRSSFSVWAPYGFDVRTALDDTTSLPPNGKELERIPDMVYRYFKSETIPAVNQWVVSQVVTARESRRFLDLVVDVSDFPDDEHAARRMFKIYEWEIDRQLSTEKKPEGWMGNDNWSSVVHRSWRIISGEEFFWFRLDLYHTEGHWRLTLEISNATLLDNLFRARQKAK